MKLKPQPPMPRRATRASRSSRPRPRGRGRGRQARRPGVPLRRRLGGRLPSLRRFIAATGALAAGALLVWLLNGPWLRVSEVAAEGGRYTDAGDLERLLASEDGSSVLAVDTVALQARLERIPSVARASVSASLTGRIQASLVEREAAFVWDTFSTRFLGAADGTIFASAREGTQLPVDVEDLPLVTDRRFAARHLTVGDVIPEGVLRVALRVGEIDPVALGSDAGGLSVRLDDEYGFRIVSDDPAWEIALGVYGVDPRETTAEADARLERQITAVRTLFASRPEEEIGWVDVRNPGKVYFRAKG